MTSSWSNTASTCKRVMRSKLALGIADGWVKADGKVIYEASDLRVGLFN